MLASEDEAASSEVSFHSSSSGFSAASFAEDDDIKDELTRTAALEGLPDGHTADAVEVTKLRMQREQRLRRILSLRHLGQPESVSNSAFFCTRAALSEEDTVWLYTLANSACFERLMRGVQSAATSSLAGHLDTVLSRANPLFYFSYRMPLKAIGGAGDTHDNFLQEAAAMQRWRENTRPVLRQRRAPASEDAAGSKRGADGDPTTDAPQRRRKTSASMLSASSGLVAQSMKAWETHLTAALTEEGETLENFRQSRAKESYTDKKSFQEKAAWEEYVREVRMQAEQRERDVKRPLRRGEVKEP
ncbi:hypothetical protein LSCM1_07381 [Leishmania martiniquensis]|uniref:BCNT-C domain-containing protein n=1 Tax=Leishmania martiniquensis TaxID=1580590 RepID=A0A836HRI5_9TRYP|nr:hypothetical protein LSCM1_07381 [Leishmania martiniquensis]